MLTELPTEEHMRSDQTTIDNEFDGGLQQCVPEGSGGNNDNPPSTQALQERHPLEFSVIIFGGVALSFNSGFMNGVCILARKLPVSHMTGTTSNAAIKIATGDEETFAVYVAMLLCFIFGSGITGCVLPSNSFKLGMQYGPLFLIGSCLLLIACLTGYFRPESYWYFYFAAMASGLQNGITTRYSGNVIRTTHVTGTVTDVGLVLGRICRGDRNEIWKLQVLLPLFFGFFFGSYASVYAHRRMGKLSLVINVVVFFIIGLVYCVIVGQQLNLPLWKAIFGYYEIIEKKASSGVKKVKSAASRAGDKIVHYNPLHS